MKKHSRLLKKEGFSLIEMIIYIGILSILLVTLTQTFTSIIQARLESESISSVEQDSNYITAKLMYDFSRATSVSTTMTYGTAYSSITLVISGVNYSYAVVNGVLQLTNNNGTNALNSINTTVSNLQFTKLGSNSIDTYKVSYTVTSVVQRAGGSDSKNYEFVVALR